MKNNSSLLSFICSALLFMLIMVISCNTHMKVKSLQLENEKLKDTLFQLHLQVLELEEELNDSSYVLV